MPFLSNDVQTEVKFCTSRYLDALLNIDYIFLEGVVNEIFP